VAPDATPCSERRESIAQYLAPSLTPPAVFDSRSILEKIVIKAYGDGASTVSTTERHCLHPGLTSTLSQRGCETWSAEPVHGQYVENVRELPALTPHDTMAREAPAFIPASVLRITGAGIVGEHAWHRRQRKCQLLQPFHTQTHRLIHVRLAPKERRKSRNANIDAMGQHVALASIDSTVLRHQNAPNSNDATGHRIPCPSAWPAQ